MSIDNEIREQIKNDNGNIIISANAGTGKTEETIRKIKQELKPNSYRSFAAITFTRKASNEILERLGGSSSKDFVGTNDNFVLSEIIQPFIADAFGLEYKRKIIPNYNNDNAVQTFQAGLSKIKNEGLLCKYSNRYINFSFQLALEILEKSEACRLYLQSKYYRIYIDEYQDSDKDMHTFFTYIADVLNIPLFIVGDIKQSIYKWRGGYEQGFVDFQENPSFTAYELYNNFRSNLAIQNYSNLFIPEVIKHVVFNSEFNDEVILFNYNVEPEAINFINSWINKEQTLCILNKQKKSAQIWSRYFEGIEYIPPSPLDYSDNDSEHIWVAREIANYCLKKNYNEFDFLYSVQNNMEYKPADLRNYLEKIQLAKSNRNDFVTPCKLFYKFLGYESSSTLEAEIHLLFDTINDDKYFATYNQKIYKHTSNTIHSSKGLAFDQIIIHASDYDLTKKEESYLHYVAISRPRNRLLILNDGKTSYNDYLNDCISNFISSIPHRKLIKIINLNDLPTSTNTSSVDDEYDCSEGYNDYEEGYDELEELLNEKVTMNSFKSWLEKLVNKIVEDILDSSINILEELSHELYEECLYDIKENEFLSESLKYTLKENIEDIIEEHSSGYNDDELSDPENPFGLL